MEETNFSTDPSQQGQNVTPQFNNQFGPLPVPNSTAVLVLGICSIFPGCFCLGLVGIICGIIALVLAGKGLAAYNSNPSSFSISSYNNLKAGKVCAIIGVCLSSLLLVFYLIYFLIIGAAFSMIPWQNMH
ncbi:MAG: CCC motif membrane protein [Bacteroidota bacterium]